MEAGIEKEEGTANNNQNSILMKKHQMMLDRLSARHQTLVENSQTRKSDSLYDSTASTSSFLSRFADSKRSIEFKLTESKAINTADPTQLKSHLANISNAISDLEKLVAENSYLLPSYEVRSSLKATSELKQSLENLNAELIPKKKFSFKNKSAVTKRESAITEETLKSDAVSKPNSMVRDSPGFRNKQNEVLAKKFDGSEIGEFTLSNLDSCGVKLIGCVNALFVNALRNCKVYVGPVMGSVLIEEAEGCVFVMASHQIRIHCAKWCDFYLRVRSRPIIEDSCKVRFASYCLEYEGIEEDLEKASLDEETGNWANVDDFKWLRAMQSPNWSILPDDQRIQSVKI